MNFFCPELWPRVLPLHCGSWKAWHHVVAVLPEIDENRAYTNLDTTIALRSLCHRFFHPPRPFNQYVDDTKFHNKYFGARLFGPRLLFAKDTCFSDMNIDAP
jgi:hypothetical protein